VSETGPFPRRSAYDAVVVGSGPNGLAAAITLAREGRSVVVLEAASTVGGGVRSAELTLPGFVHDVCSTTFPFGRGSPFFQQLDLERHGLRFIDPPIALGHPLDDGSVALLRRDVGETAAGLGDDGRAYAALFGPLVQRWPGLVPDVLAPFHIPFRPDRALRLAWFGLHAIQPTTAVARRFRGDRARALMAGVAAHAMLRLTEPISAAPALLLMASAHAFGWPIVEGGSRNLSSALEAELLALGGAVVTNRPVTQMEDLPPHRAALFDVTPRQLLKIAGDRFHGRYARRLGGYRYGPGVFKVDIAIEGEIPWRNPELREAGTVHLGGMLEEIARAESAVRSGVVPDRPFVLVAQQSNFDRSRAPVGGTTVWAYCHVPNGYAGDVRDRILGQIERYAPGFRERVLALHATDPAALEAYNANNVGGDINGGLQDVRQLFTRPLLRADPYTTPDPSIYLCSSSTPPGGGVHGMPGFHGAQSALRHRLRS
jgi:phytoene dehydrogenase-like protein